MVRRDWSRYAKALDMHLAGAKLAEIASRFAVSRERARQMVHDAKALLAFRVFKDVKRPLLHYQRKIELENKLRLKDALEALILRLDAIERKRKEPPPPC